ncbi:nucleotidyltransferase substrate binding protein [Raineya orbicola]|jgi:nucleotidyltransferase substrate binding protein (TIGR01987 family)|uniref:Nucleotidyltransferase substrate binding protein n=1 Tax=Raineya orbicola TaxID=2016530 RepID=A0A2N3IIK3_9BACT|nr:nucleotidyltransferase substrate binding protein [Raineya orbicola]PKQ70137.1 Nucleotidyltransferase substrate binding protein [Raineya orbicola]
MGYEDKWKYKLQNFSKAVALLQEIKFLDVSKLSLLEKEGIIQRFEFTIELAWKTLKERMEFEGVILDKISPKMVLKTAFHYKYIDAIDEWLAMIDFRNAISHTYNFALSEQVIANIQNKFVDLLADLFEKLKQE